VSNSTVPSGRPEAAAQSGSSSSDQKLEEGLSQFLGKVLDQLSISAWMPAAMLVGNVSILVQLHSQKNINIASALTSLTDRPLGLIIILLFSVVLATIVTQAFQYEFIRILEGYWGSGRTRSAIAGWRVRHHVKKKHSLDAARQMQFVAAYKKARDRMIQTVTRLEDIGDLQLILTSQLTDTEKVRTIKRAPAAVLWSKHCPAENLRRIEALELRIKLYPKQSRILPTRLGNTIRSSEDGIRGLGGGSLQGFIMRNQSSISTNLMVQHDQFRNRLDMYGSLVLAFLFLAVFGSMQLASNPTRFLSHSLGAILLYVILAAVSYEAAVTSAKGYGLVLLEIDSQLKRGKDIAVKEELEEM